MEKKLTALAVILFTAIISLSLPKAAYAAVSAPSATLALPDAPAFRPVDNRANVLREFLENRGSPLAEYAEIFVKEADRYDLDWRLLAAISGVESTYGQVQPAYSYNGWGYGWNGTTVRYFSSWEEAIVVISKAIREDYIGIENGEGNTYAIGSRYAASPTWAYRVEQYMQQIFEDTPKYSTLSISL